MSQNVHDILILLAMRPFFFIHLGITSQRGTLWGLVTQRPLLFVFPSAADVTCTAGSQWKRWINLLLHFPRANRYADDPTFIWNMTRRLEKWLIRRPPPPTPPRPPAHTGPTEVWMKTEGALCFPTWADQMSGPLLLTATENEAPALWLIHQSNERKMSPEDSRKEAYAMCLKKTKKLFWQDVLVQVRVQAKRVVTYLRHTHTHAWTISLGFLRENIYSQECQLLKCLDF